LLIDLKKWRKERISEKAFLYLKQHPLTPYMDQDALNFVLDRQWTKLDPRWNMQDHYSKIRPGSSGPGIVHFITKAKPWLAASRSANARLYNSFRSRTHFTRTRTEKLEDSVVRFTTGIRNVLRRGIRKNPSAVLLNGR